MADTSITRRLSFGSRTFPIDKYLSGIDGSEFHGLHYIEKQQSVPYTSKEDLEAQEELCNSLKYNYMQNSIMLKMLENIDATLDTADLEEKLKRAKQKAKEDKKEQQNVDQEIRQVITQIVQLQQKYQEMQQHLKHNLAPLNHSCELSEDKDAKTKYATIETQTDAEFEECEEDDEDMDDVEHSLERGAARMAFQRDLTKQIAGYNQIERSKTEATIRMGRDALSVGIEEGQVDLAGAFCDATFLHGDILDYAAKTKDFSLMFYEMQGRLLCRDAIAADVAMIPDAAWDGTWQVSVTLPHGQTANLQVDPNYGTEYGKVKVTRWSALDDDENMERGAELRKILESIHKEPSSTLPNVFQQLSNAPIL